ncbi:MAG TPA: hypothetical protein VFR60_07690 [Sphingomicrobium sp.]|nr:hypothetical protein [Sphingomicrobium sp.]
MHCLFVIAALLIADVEPVRVPPIDECGSDPAFVEYRTMLTDAVARKDASALQALVATDVMIDLGGGTTWAAFTREWKLERPQESGLWRELANLLQLGCEELDNSRIIPVNFSKLGEFGDALPAYFAIETGAALRSRPDNSAPIVAILDSHLLFENLEAAPDGWLNARLSDGRSGFVRLSAVRSAIDYRAGFEKRDGRWKMTSFVAGD